MRVRWAADGDLGADPHVHAGARRVRQRRPARALPAAGHRRRQDRRDRDHRARRGLGRRRASRPAPCATATRWRINGRKLFITNGIRADFLTLVAQTEPGSGHRGISLFIVDTATAGVSVSRKLKKLGMLSSDTAEIALDDVVVPHANLIGTETGQGFAQLMWQLQYERLSGAAGSIGAAQEILDQTITYARERQAFGRPIADHQVIAHKLADAATELEAARALVDSVIWRIQEGEYPVAEISMAKKYAAQVAHRLIDACLQVHGGAATWPSSP